MNYENFDDAQINNNDETNDEQEMKAIEFVDISDEELAAIEAASAKGGSKLKDSTVQLLDRFDKATEGKAFGYPVPAGTTAEKFKENIKILLANHGRKNRKVKLHNLNPNMIVVVKTATVSK